jgi:lactoylglutathione lyase
MITQIGHPAFRVRDAEASLAFYAKLGINEAFRLFKDDGSLWILYLQVNENQFVELFPGATEPVTTTPDSIGYHHFCLLVDDLAATVAELEAKGIVIDRPIKQGKDFNLQAWIVDPDGNRIELMQISPESPQAQAGERMAALAH